MAENTKVNDVEKTSEETVLTQDTEAEKPLEVKPLVNKESEKKAKDNGLIKVKLLCDVYSGNELQKFGSILELSKEELEKYAESFYKKI